MRTSEISMAIERGPGPHSKSDEFAEVRMAYNPIFTIVCLKLLNSCCTFWDLESRTHTDTTMDTRVPREALYRSPIRGLSPLRPETVVTARLLTVSTIPCFGTGLEPAPHSSSIR